MPSEHPKPDRDGAKPSDNTERRAILVVADGTKLPERLDQMKEAVRRRQGLTPVDAARDTTDQDAFTTAVIQRKQGLGDVVVVEKLPDWIVVLGALPQQRKRPR